MAEYVMDTHILADLLKQYDSGRANLPIVESTFIKSKVLDEFNLCITTDGYHGVLVCSVLAIIEIVNRFSFVANNTYKIAKVIGLINQPPNWLIIEPFNLTTSRNLIEIPKINLKGENIELADAIHLATAIQRGPGTYFVTVDSRLIQLNYSSLNVKLIN